MYYLLNLQDDFILPPRYFGPRLREVIKWKIESEITNKCSSRYGKILMLHKIEEPLGFGLVRSDLEGSAIYRVKFQAVVFRPFKGEVLDCVVTSVSRLGFFADNGMCNLFISSHSIPDYFMFRQDPDQFVTEDGEDKVIQGSEVRVRVIAFKVDESEILCIATLEGNYLGVIGQPV
eukprot:TRINITY_DN10045_c0_g1_i1.p2 TRINITY_DN10045_c0_g1~~TRINITY_DN10045_c0_g1_i1.p2  ORF type:complete len:176 (-),score=12.31 TRINITY_DN10045_c0_g1_i1:106-633(-)